MIYETEFKTFVKLIQDQFVYGGKKYAHSTEKESTDCLFDTHGKNWLFGTIHKYCFRFSNLARERDLLKIACYMYILWLKRGYFENPIGTITPINTTIDIKEREFNNFINRVETRCLNEETKTILLEMKDKELIDYISRLMGYFSQINWTQVIEEDIFIVFIEAFELWRRNFLTNAGKDADTWLEGKEK